MAVGVVERHELVGDDPGGLVDLLGGGGGVLVNKEPAKLAQAFEAASALGAHDSESRQRSEVTPGVELLAAAPDLGQLQAEGGQLGDVVVELVRAALDRLDLIQASRLLAVVRRLEHIEVEVIAELSHRRAQRDEVTAHVADAVADLGFSARARSGSRDSSGADGAGVGVTGLPAARTARALASQIEVGHGVFEREVGVHRTGSPCLRFGLELWPAAVTIDEHASMFERVRHEAWSLLGVLQTHEVHVTAGVPLKPARKLGHSRRARVDERDKEVPVRSGGGCASGLGAEENPETDVGLSAKRVAQLAQERPPRSDQVGAAESGSPTSMRTASSGSSARITVSPTSTASTPTRSSSSICSRWTIPDSETTVLPAGTSASRS